MISRIAIVGAGANGAGIGADLTNAGLDVTLIEQWPAHVHAMRTTGLRVNTPDDSVLTRVSAFDLFEVATMRQKFDLVFVLVKAYDTRWACEHIKPLVADDGVVVGLQNGMELDVIADVFGKDRTLGAVIEISANMFDPGIVNRQSAHDRSWFALGSIDPRAKQREVEVAAILANAGTVELSDDIRSSKWMKLVVNAAELVPSAILGLPLAEAVRTPGMREFMHGAGLEAARAAIASGSRLVSIFGLRHLDFSSPEGVVDQFFDRVLEHFTLPDTRTTVLQDWMKGRRSEVEQINGLVVRELGRIGEDAPLNSITVEVALRIESGEIDPGPANAELLLKNTSRV
jgi:2-dehydropantoate 2-reductase